MRSDLHRYDITLLRGDSFTSEQFMLPDGVAEDAQLWEIEEAIATGAARLLDWRDYEIKADIHKNGALWFSLSDHLLTDETGTKFWFAFTPEQTRALTPGAGVYDLQICKDGSVHTIITGSFELIPDITDHYC